MGPMAVALFRGPFLQLATGAGLLAVLAVSLLPSWPNLAASNCNVEAAVATALRWPKWGILPG